MSSYFRIQIRKVSSSAEDWISGAAFDSGALGISEPLNFEQPEGEEEVTTCIPEERTLDVFFSEPPPREFIEALKARYPDVTVEIVTEQDRDWLAEWKKSFQPFALVDGHWVVPSWCEPPAEALHKIWIDPGMAFGTGTHETTQLVAHALKEILPGTEANKISLLDVGTGTGILAILARQLGVQKIQCTEIEEEARRVAHENFERNDCSDIRLDENQIQNLTDQYDIVVANIIDGVLVRLQEDLKARTKPGGWLILSGIISERVEDFLDGFQLPSGRDWNLRQQMGDWLLFAARL